jgi:aminopeptidase N
VNQVLVAAALIQTKAELAAYQYDRAGNMTDGQGALMVLAGLNGPERTTARLMVLQSLSGQSGDRQMVCLRSGSLHPQVRACEGAGDHPTSPCAANRVTFAVHSSPASPHAFHAEDRGYWMIADVIRRSTRLIPRRQRGLSRRWAVGGGWAEPRPALMRARLDGFPQRTPVARHLWWAKVRGSG